MTSEAELREKRKVRARELLGGVTDDELRALGIEAIRNARARAQVPPRRDPLMVIQTHGQFALELVLVLAKHKSIALAGGEQIALKEVFYGGGEDSSGEPWMAGVVEFLAWLTRSGLAIELHPRNLHLTRRGAALLDGDEDNPLLPKFLDRIRERCPDLPDGVRALLSDARACLDHSLLRPAVMLMGVAYELAIEEVIRVLMRNGHLEKGTLKQEAGDRVKRVRDFIRTDALKAVLPERDDRRRAEAAYDFADQLRLRRNDAAHTRPTHDFVHLGETEEYLVSAGRHLPGLWSLTREPKP
jgi:hypothetical protein